MEALIQLDDGSGRRTLERRSKMGGLAGVCFDSNVVRGRAERASVERPEKERWREHLNECYRPQLLNIEYV